MSAPLHVMRFDGNDLVLVGNIDRTSGSFSYTPIYLATESATPISQSLPLRSQPYNRRDNYAYFEGLLPEGVARRELAAQLHVRETDYLDLLAHCGRECIGDVVITSSENFSTEQSFEPVDIAQLERLFSTDASLANGNTENRLSLAGVQGKTGLAHEPNAPLDSGWLIPHGLAASTHILKTGSLQDLPFLEYLCMNAVRACGIPAPSTDLLNLKRPVICSTRFDRIVRKNGGMLHVQRLHQEDIAQAMGISSGSKYAGLNGGTAHAVAALLRTKSASPLQDLRLFAQILCADYLLGNCDNHLKNFSLLSSPSGGAIRLAPAYDITCTTRYDRFSRDMGIRIGRTFCIDEVSPDDFSLLAQDIGVAPRALKTISRALATQAPDAIMRAAEADAHMFPELPFIADDLIADMEPRRIVLEAFANS